MKRFGLRELIFLALCCDLGLFSKKLVGPLANVVTEALHIPGGVATAFSLLFVTVGAAVIGRFGCATVMGAVQSVLALGFGMVGSMGALAPIGYLMPGVVIDLALLVTRRLGFRLEDRVTLANTLAGGTAGLTANLIVFRLRGPVLALYLLTALFCGGLCGLLGGQVARRLPVGENRRKHCENGENVHEAE